MDASTRRDRRSRNDGAIAAHVRATPLVILALAAAAVVAIMATGRSIIVPRLDLAVPGSAILRLAGAIVAGAGLTGLFLLRRRLPFKPMRRHDPAAGALATAATTMAALTIVALLAPRERGPARPEPPRRVATEPAPDRPDLPGGPAQPFQLDLGGGLAQESLATGGGTGEEQVDPELVTLGSSRLARIARSLLPILLVVLVFFALRSLRARTSGRTFNVPDTNPPLPRAAAERGLAASLDTLTLDGGDPASRITAAYMRLLRALAAAGAPRLSHEAPHEHLYRVLGPLGVRPEPMHRLAALCVTAGFGTRSMTEDDCAAAAHALEEAMAGLRAANRLPPAEAAA